MTGSKKQAKLSAAKTFAKNEAKEEIKLQAKALLAEEGPEGAMEAIFAVAESVPVSVFVVCKGGGAASSCSQARHGGEKQRFKLHSCCHCGQMESGVQSLLRHRQFAKPMTQRTSPRSLKCSLRL